MTKPLLDITLWPHRSLSPRAFRAFIAFVGLALLVPLIPIIGTQAAWVLGGFLLLDLALLYGLMKLTYRSGRLREHLRIWPDRLQIERIEPNGARKVWEANPLWVRIELLNTRSISNYLVLSSSGRDIELGAFLTPEERRELAGSIREAISRI